ncbi:hypothetical protein C8J57DRAFT_1440557 [Mycena rebaudengoi]|nr:hypothetical protein C8J57DRAFT_1440557 [Mycena rebaudengoi]
MPCSPFTPTVAVSTCVLEMYRIAHLRCPTLSIQAWVKTLSDLHHVPYKPYLTQQFTTCFDLYLQIRKRVEERVLTVLGRGQEDWGFKHHCPACTYKLEGEPDLIFSMLVTADGNNSLKRVLQKDRNSFDEEGNATRGRSEREDPRIVGAGEGYYLSHEKVDMWAKHWLAEMVDVPTSDDPEEQSACEERWKNLSKAITSKMWGIFDETGVFVALCRHGFVLLITDMVKSGELGKYGLAVADALMKAFGKDLALGYDIGCGFKTTIRNSPLGREARRLNFRCLVGAFHGHAHYRECQLKFLVTYMKGLGIEDLERCERLFSVTDGLSRSVPYASVFHRLQTITKFVEHRDTFEVYANLSTFLVNNYKQAINIIDGEEGVHRAMAEVGIESGEVFRERLAEELTYLQALKKDPDTVTDMMDYYQKLVLSCSNRPAATDSVPLDRFEATCKEGSKVSATVRRHARENFDQAIQSVQSIEEELDITERWTPESWEWEEAAILVAQTRYRACINKLEALVIKRLFELTKMNHSQTGYKHRRHIAKALQARSKAIRNALTRYNQAAKALSPPGPELSWQQVVDYSFLSDFDLLRDPAMSTAVREWGTPAARELLDSYFRIERAKEEIVRLDVEIRCLVMHIRDKRVFLLKKEAEIQETNPVLAFFIGRYRQEHGRFDASHLKRFARFATKIGPRFMADLTPEPCDVEAEAEREAQDARETEKVRLQLESETSVDSDVEDDEGEEAEEQRASETTENILLVSGDDDEEKGE